MNMHCARQSNRAGLSPTAMSKARLLTRKGLINHASKHRGSSACELMDWLNCEVREPTRGTTALASQYPQGGEKSRNPSSFICVWGRGRLSGEFMGVHAVMSLASGARFGKTEVIELILKMKELDREYAKHVYARENALHPEWELRAAFMELKAAK